MKKKFTYWILQYRHSLLINETINVGILFEFPEDRIVRFVEGNLARLKLIYTDFNTSVTTHLIRNIQNKIYVVLKDRNSLLNEFDRNVDLHKHLLREDDSSLQFSKRQTAIYPFDKAETIINEYSNLFLPNYNNKKEGLRKHNENFILKTYTNYIFDENKELEIAVNRNRIVESNEVKLNFDISWENGTTNLVRPVSFDLKDEQDIQNKSVTYFGYLTKLNKYAVQNNLRYDLLIWRPQDTSLLKKYEQAVKIIKSADAPKKVVEQHELEAYSKETVKYLHIKYEKLKASL